MFTGIVEEVGVIRDVRRGGASARLVVSAPRIAEDTRIGDSIAISGVCLTVVSNDGASLAFDATPETLRRSSLRDARAGATVNLERAISASGRFGGHIVQGHVDGVGKLVSATCIDNAQVVRIAVPPELLRYIAPKGSVAVDGISLTSVDVDADGFTVWVIPHTWENTNLSTRRSGDALNIEVDLLARYIERLLAGSSPGIGSTLERLAQAGFLEGV
jgi:riboflavin synthase